jgi:23S rRNA (cytidine1920-2'-O)/16S rRNA (cytidine1409-2'-O)-methyltransferase
VRNAAAHARVEARIRGGAGEAGLLVRDWFESPITGGDGNHEFFVRAQRAPGDCR